MTTPTPGAPDGPTADARGAGTPMADSPALPAPGTTTTRRRRSLSGRLSLFVVLVVTLSLAAMVAVSGVAMGRWMTSQIDSDLQGALHRVQLHGQHDLDDAALGTSDSGGSTPDDTSSSDDTPSPDGTSSLPGPPFGPSPSPSAGSGEDTPQSTPFIQELGGPGSSEGSLQLVEHSGQVQAGVITDYSVGTLDAGATTTLLAVPTDARGHTVRLGDLGTFRVVAQRADGTRVVVGQSMERTERTTAMLMVVEGVLAVLIAGASGAFGLRWMHREMVPLARVAAVARRIGDRDLQQDRIEPLDRVDPRFAEPGTEVGDVGTALNTMIDNVETALTERAHSERTLRQFVADASHELRTPLASIIGYTQLLQMDSVDPETALSRIASESRRMSGLVEDMLLLARLDAGRELRSEPVDVVPLVVDAVSDGHAAGGDHDWSLDIDEDAADSCVVLGDETGIRQVLANLVTNARVHTPPGTRVTVGVHGRGVEPGDLGIVGDEEAWRPGTGPAGSVRITVADDGPGIPAEVRPKVFDRFVRGDASRTRAGTGSSGLGLAIVASITEALGGRVDLETSAAGTTFTVVLPRATASSATDGAN